MSQGPPRSNGTLLSDYVWGWPLRYIRESIYSDIKSLSRLYDLFFVLFYLLSLLFFPILHYLSSLIEVFLFYYSIFLSCYLPESRCYPSFILWMGRKEVVGTVDSRGTLPMFSFLPVKSSPCPLNQKTYLLVSSLIVCFLYYVYIESYIKT